ncbi:hypothetical protein WMY93_014764 [Mugilogobius chulae]|uniref:Uncharacterized protein n=1 Tax=Mugilogobius chulae TaxID=88201 RepID=A0AAW0NZQ6_9GOBI
MSNEYKQRVSNIFVFSFRCTDMATNLSSNISETSCQYAFPEVMVSVWSILYIFFTPIFLCVLYEGYKRMKSQQSPLSHIDVFTFAIIAMEILTTIGGGIVMFKFRDQRSVTNQIDPEAKMVGPGQYVDGKLLELQISQMR